MRMDRVAHECAAFLSAHIDLRSCLEIRALPGVVRSKDLVARVDAFIDEHMEELVTLRPIMQIDRVCVEVLHASRQELDCASARALCQLVLDWIHSQWLEDERLTLDALKSKNHLLYLGSDNTLEDCEEIEEGSANDSEIVQDYKKSNQQIPKQAKKVSKIMIGITISRIFIGSHDPSRDPEDQSGEFDTNIFDTVAPNLVLNGTETKNVNFCRKVIKFHLTF